MPNKPANLKFLSQASGEFVEQGKEPAWVVNMDDDDALSYIETQRKALGLFGLPAGLSDESGDNAAPGVGGAVPVPSAAPPATLTTETAPAVVPVESAPPQAATPAVAAPKSEPLKSEPLKVPPVQQRGGRR